MLVATGHEMIAREITKGNEPGYRRAVLGDYEWSLFQRLYARVRQELAKRHVHQKEFDWQLTVGAVPCRPYRVGR
jgi:hypothetical protein